MYGAILGDIIGSPYEFDKDVDGVKKTKDFEFFKGRAKFTDDTVMTIAVAEALLEVGKNADEKTVCQAVVNFMQKWGRKYPGAGYGSKFKYWLKEENPQPYNSWGNGSAMRVSAVGWLYDTLERTREVARWTAQVSHNHPEGIKGAESTASAIFLARNGATKDEIKKYIEENFGYDLNRSLDEIRQNYYHVEGSHETVPEAIIAFLESKDFEDAIRNGVSLGGDADTLTCIDGSIAEAFYKIPENLIEECRKRLPFEILKVLDKFDETLGREKKINWRERNRKVAEETLKITEQGFYEIGGKKINLVGKNFDEVIVVSPTDSENFGKKISAPDKKIPAKISVVAADTFSVCKSEKNFLAMNFANAKYPGGGFLSGANAQEESLCRESTLYESLSSYDAAEMYNYNHTHNKHCYSDYMTISPNVCVFRDIKDNFLDEPFLTSVITIPAPNLNGAAKNVPQEKIDEIMTARLKKMFDVAIYHGYKNLVLGAWGCGAFGNNPEKVAGYFYKLLFDEKYRFYFDKIIFAIYDKGEKKNYNAFKNIFCE